MSEARTWAPTQLELIVLRAKDLKVKGKNGFDDPYCVMELGKEKFATRSIPSSLAPEWNEQCLFKTLLDRTLRLSVWHKGGSLEKDRYLGRCTVELSTININAPPKVMWIKLLPREGKEQDLSNRGQLEVSIGYVQDGNTNPKSPVKPQPQPQQPTTNKQITQLPPRGRIASQPNITTNGEPPLGEPAPAHKEPPKRFSAFVHRKQEDPAAPPLMETPQEEQPPEPEPVKPAPSPKVEKKQGGFSNFAQRSTKAPETRRTAMRSDNAEVGYSVSRAGDPINIAPDYDAMTRDQLRRAVTDLAKTVKSKEEEIKNLNEYIDNLVLKIIERDPELLHK